MNPDARPLIGPLVARVLLVLLVVWFAFTLLMIGIGDLFASGELVHCQASSPALCQRHPGG